ncbi:MAG: FAD binding domain-containing protein, partial [Firmicutes bacterium]|nr:FAD binding domain-containing protein [Bacillota bacterium]
LAIGALVRHSTLSQHPLIEREVPVLAEAARHIGHWAIRNRGTIGGSAVHADPAAELPAALVALRASVVVGAPRGERTMPADEFFLGYYTTALAQDELVMRFEIPLPARRMGFSEVVRRPGDFALVGAYVEDSDAEAAVTWFGLGAMPERQVVEAWPKGQDERQALLERLAREVQSDDEYKYAMAVNVAERAYLAAQKEG